MFTVHLWNSDNHSLGFILKRIRYVQLRGSPFKVDLAINEQSVVVRDVQQGQRHYLVLFPISIQRQWHFFPHIFEFKDPPPVKRT